MEWDKLLSTERFVEQVKLKSERYFKKYEDGFNTEFEKDYQTIINSASFRRLQDKTQVFPLEKNDFVRTRLTHSLETSSIAKKLGNMILENIKNESDKRKRCYRDYEKYNEYMRAIPEVLACAGLLHDIGNPPFGHFGEIAMSDWFKDNLSVIEYDGTPLCNLLNDQQIEDLYNLEGNAQAIRVVGKLHFLDNDYGMNLTKSLLNVLIKYPTESRYINKKSPDIRYHKLGFYENDCSFFKEIVSSTGTELVKEGYARHPLTYLLEAVDDIAYATADLEDAFKKRLLTLEKFIEFSKQHLDEKDNDKVKQLFDELSETSLKTKKISKNDDLQIIQVWLNKARNWLMYGAAYGFVKNYDAIMEGKYNQEIMLDKDVFHKKTLEILKQAAIEFVFKNDKINKVEISGSVVLTFLLDKFINSILYYDAESLERNMTKEHKKLIGLLPDNYIENYIFEKQNYKNDIEKLYLRIHLITDFICGMTDSYAKRLYQELHGIYFVD